MERVRIDCEPVPVGKLATNDVQQLFELFEKHYDCVNFETFCKDLYKKDQVIVARKATTGDIKGFTTLKIMDIEYELDGKKRHATGIFSGDTIVSPEYWGTKVINSAFAATLLREKAKRPFSPLYWFLISKGYKTYLLLTNNFLEYYPNMDRPTPPHIQKVIDAYATTLYPEAYRPETGLLEFDDSLGQLKSTVAPIDDKLLATQPKIRFFQEKNPGWRHGDELVCLGVISWRLFAYYAYRTVRHCLRGFVKRQPAAEKKGSKAA